MLVRPERAEDLDVIHRITEEAFRSMKFSDGSEPAIIDRLRADGDLTLSLVAESDEEVVGHVAFSPVRIGDSSDDGWFGLGPVAVAPRRQRTGIGTKMITEGLRMLEERGARGVALIGSAEYYRRFGFIGDGRLEYGGLPDQLVQWLAFRSPPPGGELRFSKAFSP